LVPVFVLAMNDVETTDGDGGDDDGDDKKTM
jgi:hypothetical protein